MIQLTLQGKTQSEIAKVMDCNQSTISHALKELSLFRRGQYKRKKLGPRAASKRREEITPRVLYLYHYGYPISHIGIELNATTALVKKILTSYNLDVSVSRGRHLGHMLKHIDNVEKIVDFLESYGPQHLKSMKLTPKLMQYLSSDKRIKFIKTKIGFSRFGKNRELGNIGTGRKAILINAIAASDDPRIPSWLASQVPWKIVSTGEASAIMRCLRNTIGREAAAITIEMLGHQYESTPLPGIYTLTEWEDMRGSWIS